MKKKNKRVKRGFGIIFGILLVAFCAIVIGNRFRAEYSDLSKTDQFILKELDTYCRQTKKSDIWQGFQLEDKTVTAIGDSFGSIYLINPQKEVQSLFAKKISMPDGYEIEVYRIAAVDPQLLQFWFDGNFNSLEEIYKLCGNDVYYTKYNKEDAVDRKFSSSHYITFLTHEAFHYYMQNGWAKGNTYSVEAMSKEDQELLYQEYEILDKIQKALLEETKEKEQFLAYAKEYVEIVKKRIEKNPQYVEKELDRETIEGTATYVGIKASKLAGYDFGIMYFDNVKDVPFSDLKRTVGAGAYGKSELAERIPYESGAILCMLMDEIDIPDWQLKLNMQTKDNQTTLFSIIQEFVEE